MTYTLQNARLVDASGDLAVGDISFAGGSVTSVGSGLGAGETLESLESLEAPAASDVADVVIDASGLIVMPGFVETHTHGGGGHSLHTTDADEIRAYARWAPRTGVTAFLAGVVGVAGALPEAQLAAVIAVVEGPQVGAQALGVHLEGPYISERKRGAHLTTWLRTPDEAETKRLLALTRGYLRLLTLASELPGAAAMIRRLAQAGVTVSLGHTDATYEQALEALRQGVTQVTHCCNAMRPLLQRDPGPLAALSETPGVYGEIIADGVHVHPAMVRALMKLLGPDRAIIITDAQAAAGAEGGTFEFGGQPVYVSRGAARLADGALTGSVLTMDQALRNTLQMTGVSLSEASAMLSRNPARVAGAAETKGLLLPGYDADLLVFDADLNLQATFCRGELAYASEAWQARASVRPLAAQ